MYRLHINLFIIYLKRFVIIYLVSLMILITSDLINGDFELIKITKDICQSTTQQIMIGGVSLQGSLCWGLLSIKTEGITRAFIHLGWSPLASATGIFLGYLILWMLLTLTDAVDQSGQDFSLWQSSSRHTINLDVSTGKVDCWRDHKSLKRLSEERVDTPSQESVQGESTKRLMIKWEDQGAYRADINDVGWD